MGSSRREQALADALAQLHNATLAEKTNPTWWLDIGEPAIRAALAIPERR